MTDDSLLKVHRKVGSSSMIKCSPDSFFEDKYNQINVELICLLKRSLKHTEVKLSLCRRVHPFSLIYLVILLVEERL